ncbi:MAG: hypothetical protein E7588_01740 [Ruminococcaceae bacterium]|nr:hypothetical protein [Oscillospiraceae bacterium]
MLYLAENASVFEKLGYGFKIMLLGMGTVFSILLILFLVLTIFRLVFASKPQNKANKVVVNNKPENKPLTVAVSDASPHEDENELVAVIMAAVYAASGAAPGTLRMISCKKRQKTPWNRK